MGLINMNKAATKRVQRALSLSNAIAQDKVENRLKRAVRSNKEVVIVYRG